MKAALLKPPTDGFSADRTEAMRLPRWLWVLSLAVFFTAAHQVATRGGHFHPLVYAPYRSTNDLEKLRPKFDPQAAVLAKGKTIYRQNCAPCHGDMGEGDVAKQAPPLAGSEWVLAPAADRIIRVVLHGLQGPLTVKGQSYGAAAMLAWRDLMSDADIAATLTFVRQSWGNQGPVVTPDTVRQVRDLTRTRSDPWTEADLLQIPDTQ